LNFRKASMREKSNKTLGYLMAAGSLCRKKPAHSMRVGDLRVRDMDTAG
jgi:hypothetical protein